MAFSHSALTTVVSGDGDDDEAIATVAEEEWRARDECRDGRGRRATMQGDARVSAADIKVTADLDRGCVLGRPKGPTFVSARDADEAGFETIGEHRQGVENDSQEKPTDSPVLQSQCPSGFQTRLTAARPV